MIEIFLIANDSSVNLLINSSLSHRMRWITIPDSLSPCFCGIGISNMIGGLSLFLSYLRLQLLALMNCTADTKSKLRVDHTYEMRAASYLSPSSAHVDLQ